VGLLKRCCGKSVPLVLCLWEYLWTPDQELNIGACYDVLDKPYKEGNLFGVMGYYLD